MQEIIKGKAFGTATVGERGQVVIPAELRKEFNIKAGEQIMIFANLDKKIISFMSAKDFSKFLDRAAKIISKLESKVKHK